MWGSPEQKSRQGREKRYKMLSELIRNYTLFNILFNILRAMNKKWGCFLFIAWEGEDLCKLDTILGHHINPRFYMFYSCVP